MPPGTLRGIEDFSAGVMLRFEVASGRQSILNISLQFAAPSVCHTVGTARE